MGRVAAGARPAVTPEAVQLARQRNVILAALLGVGAVAWYLVVRGARGEMAAMPGGLGLSMGMGAVAFVTMWTVMMIAMMFPASAPMILVYSSLQARKRAAGRPYVPASIFTGAYVLVWAGFGVLAFGLALGLDRLAERSPWLVSNWPRIAGVLIVAAGVYQLTPLKAVCLGKCRSPLGFLLAHWKDGRLGAFLMGLRHGGYCVGCCWLLFVILVPLGVMNLVAMALITVVVFAERMLPLGEWTARVAAVGLVAYGVVVLLFPETLPGTM